jgi:hypothetical protein
MDPSIESHCGVFHDLVMSENSADPILALYCATPPDSSN